VDESRKRALDITKKGAIAEVNALPTRVVGFTRETQSLASSIFAFASLDTALAYTTTTFSTEVLCQSDAKGNIDCSNNAKRLPQSEWGDTKKPPRSLRASDAITHILVKAKAGTNIETLRQRINQKIDGVKAMTRSEVANQTRNYWKDRTGIGFILGMGAALGVVVGIVIVSQILYSSVSDHIKEFGTLKAMGASDQVLYGVIIEQSLWMAVTGYIPGTLLCVALSHWTANSMGVIILITPLSSIAVFGITVTMCVGSAFFAIQKVTRVDPAIVFKA
jgi:putative ABC transport system permease protein